MPMADIPDALRWAQDMLLAGRPAQAEFVCRQVVQQQPQNFEAQLHLGTALAQMGRLDEAESCLLKAARIRPDHAGVYINLGHVYRSRDLPAEAIRFYGQAIERAPSYAPTYQSLGSAYREVGKIDEATECFRRAVGLEPGAHRVHSNLVYLLYYHPRYSPEAVFAEHRQWARLHADPLLPTSLHYVNDRDPNRRLRVGYVSPDLRNHVIGMYVEPVIQNHNRQDIQIFCYSDAAGRSDELTARLRSRVDDWRDTRALTDEQLADAVRRDGIDILVDLTLHMAGNRLTVFARRPAPIQMTYLAYPGTSGMAAMDYKVTDVHLDPPGLTERYHSERLLRLPGSYWCYTPPPNCPEVNALPAGDSGPVTFGALNSFAKVNPQVVAEWAKVLNATPGSRLLVLIAGGERGSTEARAMLQRGGIDGQRVEFLGRRPRAEFCRYFHRVDISLDPFPYNGHTTSLDSLWMGVPVVTLEGESAVGRAGVSILSNLGLPELIARGGDDYVSKAVALANDKPLLQSLRRSLRPRMAQSALTNGPRIAAESESLYRAAWREWCSGRTG